jgi:PST family polysaccharide transporter
MVSAAEITDVVAREDAAEAVVATSTALQREELGRRPAEVSPHLGSLTTRGGVYLGFRYGLGVLIGMGNMFVLTWWIGPHAYGIFLTAIGLTAFLAALTRSGVDTYLIRRAETPEPWMYEVANTLIVGLSGVLFIAGVVAVPLLVRWYGNRDFEAPYLVLLLTVPVVGLAGPPTAKLERELRFGTVAQIELGGQVLALLVALTLAWRGFGVWAPVLGQLAWQVTGMVAAMVAARFRPRFRFEKACAKEMLSFGVGYTASLRTWQLRTLVNPLLVGRFAGAEGVAYVGFAIRVAEGLGFIRVAAARLAIAALARLQENQARLRAALESALTIQVLVLGPLLCIFALAGPYVVPVAMGARWLPSLRVYPFIAAGVLVNSIFNLQASALFVVGEQWVVLKAYAAHVVLLALGTLFLIPRLGLAGYGWADLAACAGYVFLQTGVARAIRISHRRLLRWGVAFTAPLFAPMMHARWAWLLCLPLAGSVIAWAGSRVATTRDEAAGQGLPVVEKRPSLAKWRDRCLTLYWKTRQRGIAYVTGLVRYKVSSQWYDVRIKMKRFSPWRQEHEVVAEEMQAPDYRKIVRRGSLAFARRQDVSAKVSTAFFGASTPAILAAMPDLVKWRAVAEAEQIVQRRFRFRGIEIEMGQAIDWNTCPGGNVSWQWDLNRHRFLVALGTAFHYSGNRKYAEELIELWEQWIRANPRAETAAWEQPFEVASRLRNWIFAYFLLEGSGLADKRRLKNLRRVMVEHAQFVRAHLEWHWPNNHLLLEAKTLHEYCVCFPEDGGKASGRAARRILERTVLQQILPDGVHAELCSMYHLIVSGELFQLMRLVERTGEPLTEDVQERIRRSVEFTRVLARDDGTTAMLGDSAQDDVNLRFDFRSAEKCELLYWADGSSDSRAKGERHEQVTSSLFHEGGYAILRNKTESHPYHLTLDCGPFSRCASPNHGHADALSFELHADGRALIVDPGVYLPWGSGREWTRYFRSTAAHNTLVIDGREQSELSNYADVHRTARITRVEVGELARGEIAAICRPYWGEADHIEHRRKICDRKDGRICIRDRVTGAGRHRLEWFFHFAHDLDAVPLDATTVSLRGAMSGREYLRLGAESDSPLKLRLIRGRRDPLCGWVSLNSAQVIPAWVAVFEAEVEVPCLAEFELQIMP